MIVGNTERLAFAADSRAIDDRYDLRTDDECKATALGQEGIFAEVGLDTIQRPRATDLARNLFNDLMAELNHRTPAEKDLIKLGHGWGEKMKESLLGMGFDRVVSATHSDIFTSGIFAMRTSSGLLGLLQVDLMLERTKRTISVTTRLLAVLTETRFYAFGRTGVFDKLTDRSSKWVPEEVAELRTHSIAPDSWQFAEWLVQMTIKYDTSLTVGGPIDILQIDRSSGVAKWVRRKQFCQ